MPQVNFKLDGLDRSLEASVDLPDQPLRPDELLPVFLGMANALVQMYVASAAEEGREVSCKAGCGACCRQLVPVSEPEALHLANLVAQMDPARRQLILDRFRDAQARSAPLLAEAMAVAGNARSQRVKKIGAEYFHLGIPCPFLENESCSIHADRPSTCREYLVTSPPEHCGNLNFVQIEGIRMSHQVSTALFLFSDGQGTAEPNFMPMQYALDWAAAQNQAVEPIQAVDLFSNFLRTLFSRGQTPVTP